MTHEKMANYVQRSSPFGCDHSLSRNLGLFDRLSSDDLDSLTQFYKGREAVFRTQYNEAMKAVEAEAVRKAKAGEPAATSKESTSGTVSDPLPFLQSSSFPSFMCRAIRDKQIVRRRFQSSTCLHRCKSRSVDQVFETRRIHGDVGRRQIHKVSDQGTGLQKRNPVSSIRFSSRPHWT
jgi:hypothetical protein